MMTPFTQTKTWADMNEYYNGLEPKIFNDAEISCLFGSDRKHASWTSFNGPVASGKASDQDFSNFLTELRKAAKKNNTHQIYFRSLPPLREWPLEFENELREFGFKRQEWKTLITDLTVSEEKLLKCFEHSARKGIKKAVSLGVIVEKCSGFDQYFSDFLIPYYKTTERPLKEKEFYRKGWLLDTENIYHYWVAKDSMGEPLGFLGTYTYDGIATEIMSALTLLAFEKKIPAQDILHWEVIKYHKNVGDLYFDLAGFNPNPTSEKEKNIKRFKEKWGGKIYDVSSYYLDNRSFLQKIILKMRGKINA